MDIEDKIKKDEPLGPRTTFGIGGPAKYYFEVQTKDDLTAALAWAETENEKYFILGSGSNLLVNDVGFNGLVIKPINREIKILGERIMASTGAILQNVVRQAISQSLSGLEWATGIPGTVGGAIRGNAGAFGGAIADSLENVEIFDLKKKKFILFSRKDCYFDYRDSIFKDINTLIIWQATFKLRPNSASEIKALVEKYIGQRLKTQPKLPSAGSIFKNPSLEEIRNSNPELAAQAMAEGVVRDNLVSAGWVIGQLDMAGKKIGDAKISLEHNNFIVNTGKGSADNVVTLISYIKQQVRTHLKIQLIEEVKYVGFD